MLLRDPNSPAQPGQAHAGWLLALIAALALSACGATQGDAGEKPQRGQTGGDGSLTQTAARSEGHDGHCEKVGKPKPKGPQHVPKPTLSLDPSKTYMVKLDTNCGSIFIKLAVQRAPQIAASFAYLVQRGFYDDLTFHLVLSGFVIQGGDPNGDGSGGPGYEVVEQPPKQLRYTPGTVAMAKAATDPPGASGSQFFIVTGKNVELPAQYALLGKVVKGWNTVTAISDVPTEDGPEGEDSAPTSPIVISKATLSSS
ncbi:MAG TPA: peptidylprolyl isomerase [Solirubrobacteraceae bacterium]